jgi:hypothetical protein
LIGPTVFHLLFPLPKFSKQGKFYDYIILDINENELTFSKVKFPKPFEVRRVLSQDKPTFTDQELMQIDPNNFLQTAKNKMEGKTII